MSNETDPRIKEIVDRRYQGRKAKGVVGPINRRVFDRESIEELLQSAFDLGRQQTDQPAPQLLDWLLDYLPELRVHTSEPCRHDPTHTIGQARWLGTVELDAAHYPWAPGERLKLVSELWRLIKKRDNARAKKMKGQ